MASIDTTTDFRPTYASLRGLFSVFSRLGEWNDARETRKQLSRLTAAELEDIGLTRGDIARVARRSARR